MFSDYPPTKTNSSGARWNPRGIEAIYASLERETALSEAEYQISVQPLRPRAKRTLYRVHVLLRNVVDLRSLDVLDRLSLSQERLAAIDHLHCQRIGGAVEWMGYEGLLVPSVRRVGGTNLVIYPTKQSPDSEFEVVGSEVISESDL
jgi:RES domain-containing protein